jgi:glycine betaine/proline transport system substrate-binding protein
LTRAIAALPAALLAASGLLGMSGWASGLAAAGPAGHAGPAAPAAADPPSCALVRMSTPGWSDLQVTNDITSLLLRALGYQQHLDTLSVAITYRALANGQLDVFLGDWTPAHDPFTDPLLGAKKIERLNRNLTGAKYTLVVPDYVAAAGVRSFADLATHAARFGYQIYGIDEGSPGNERIEATVAGSGLAGWNVVSSSEQGMLAQASRDISRKRWIVFLGWEPHPMNLMFKLVYLSGGDEYFGPDFGGGQVYTVARAGFSRSCPNLARLFRQVSFSVAAEDAIMAASASGNPSSLEAARAYLKGHPELLGPWLEGVVALDGRAGAAAVKTLL